MTAEDYIEKKEGLEAKRDEAVLLHREWRKCKDCSANPLIYCPPHRDAFETYIKSREDLIELFNHQKFTTN